LKQHGRKSAQELVVSDLSVLDRVERAKPPHPLTDEESEVWFAVVNSEAADWFSAGNIPLLTQYCRHVVHCTRLGELLEKATSDRNLDIRDYDRLLRMQQRESQIVALLATKMRLTQKSLINHNGNKKKTASRKPWEG
jgi:hypothetical protein